MLSEQLAWLIRRHAVEMTHISGGSHIGSIMSVADIIAVLYADIMRYRTDEPAWEGRDRFILSKGHAGAAIYAALAEIGFFPFEELKTMNSNGSRLSGHASHMVPGIEVSTGSLGHGIGVACGMAYAAKKDGLTNHKIYVVLGDGECNEGAVWESALFANHFRLDNMIAIIDHNHMQSLDFNENVLELEDFGSKWKSFGWNTIEINGNDHEILRWALREAAVEKEPHKPTVVIADTIKGYGVQYMQNDILWHYRFPHEGWEYDMAVSLLHEHKPDGVVDPYTPDGIKNPVYPGMNDDIGNDHTFSFSWHPRYPEKMRRVEAHSNSDEKVHKV